MVGCGLHYFLLKVIQKLGILVSVNLRKLQVINIIFIFFRRFETVHPVLLRRIPPAVTAVDQEAEGHPDRESDPGLPGEFAGEEYVCEDGGGGKPGDQWHGEGEGGRVLGLLVEDEDTEEHLDPDDHHGQVMEA